MAKRIDSIENKLPGTPADIWASGVIMYTMLMGYLPFDNYDESYYEQIVNGYYKFISNDWKNISDHASDLVRNLKFF